MLFRSRRHRPGPGHQGRRGLPHERRQHGLRARNRRKRRGQHEASQRSPALKTCPKPARRQIANKLANPNPPARRTGPRSAQPLVQDSGGRGKNVAGHEIHAWRQPREKTDKGGMMACRVKVRSKFEGSENGFIARSTRTLRYGIKSK